MITLRQLGLEIECYHATADRNTTAANLVAHANVTAIPAPYSSTNFTVWQVKPDGSLRGAGINQEIVSRTLPGTEESIEEIRRVATYLEANGYKVNKTHGLHIHLSVADLTRHECAVIAWRYALLQDSLKAVLPRSRWDGTNNFAPFATSSSLSKITAAARDPQTSSYWTHGERYTAVNLEHAHKSRAERRIEFRQAAGTVNADKIIGWYRFLCEFVAETVRLVRTPAPQAETGVASVTSVTTHETRPAAVPPLRAGTDNYKFITTLETYGIITQADARSFGWPDTRLRVVAHALRRLGANIVVINHNGEGAYVVPGHRYNVFRHDIFTQPAVVRRVRRAPAAAPLGTSFDLEAVVRVAPLEQGLSDSTVAWLASRRETLARRAVRGGTVPVDTVAPVTVNYGGPFTNNTVSQ
jgi:hypothetical protein